MHVLTVLAHVSGELHTHAQGVTFILLGLAIGALCFYFKRTA